MADDPFDTLLDFAWDAGVLPIWNVVKGAWRIRLEMNDADAPLVGYGTTRDAAAQTILDKVTTTRAKATA